MDYVLAAQIFGAFFACWFITYYVSTTAFPTLQGKKIVLLIAHPDDEAMFFAPTLRWLTRPELGNQVIILCFSSGDADGLGHIRKGELIKSALQLGIRSTEHIIIIEDEKFFPDSMTATWDPKVIGNLLVKNFAPKLAKTPSTVAPTSYVDTIITFDAHGVSGHPNHSALFFGAHAYLKALMQRHSGWDCPTKLYTLTSTSVVRKYISLFDSIITVLMVMGRQLEKGSFPTPLIIVSGPLDILRAQKAMRTAHKSQMRWFRWGWIGFSRYMCVNDLSRSVSGGEWDQVKNAFAKVWSQRGNYP